MGERLWHRHGITQENQVAAGATRVFLNRRGNWYAETGMICYSDVKIVKHITPNLGAICKKL
jgi:hypothetical protein